MFWRKPKHPHTWLPEPVGTERLILSPVVRELVPSYLGLMDAEFLEVHHWPPELLDLVQRGLKASRSIRSQMSANTALIVPRESPGVVAGFISADLNQSQPHLRAERLIGIHLAPPHRNIGYLSEALPAAIDAMDAAGLTKVFLAMSTDNVAMIRVCEKLDLFEHPADTYDHPDGTSEVACVFQALPR